MKTLFVRRGESLLRRYNRLQSSLPWAVFYLLIFLNLVLVGTVGFLHNIPKREWLMLALDSFVALFGAFSALDMVRIIRAILHRRRTADQ